MKRTERHKLKENEFARTVAHARDVLEARQRDITTGLIVAIVALVGIGGYVWWRQARNARANEMLGTALAVYDAPVVPLAAPAPGSPAPVPQPGTYPTEQAKLEAALPRFQEAADRYANAQAGIAARFHQASILASMGRYGDAEKAYQEVVDKAGNSIYGRTARLGLADAQVAQGKYDDAIAIYTELSRATDSHMPVDGILMQLGRAYAKAGRKEEAVRAYNRVVQEFPQSLYAADARRELEDVKKAG